MTLECPIPGGPEGRASVSDRGDAHTVSSLGLFRTLSPPLSRLLPALKWQLAPKLFCYPGPPGA